MRITTESSVASALPSAVRRIERDIDVTHARDVDYILDELFFTVGQIVGTRKALDYEAAVWWRDHYRETFLRAMTRFGNRWTSDRDTVSAVAMMLAERAVRHAADASSISLATAKRATEDTQRYCELHSRRRARSQGDDTAEGVMPLRAGYWCVPDPIPPAP